MTGLRAVGSGTVGKNVLGRGDEVLIAGNVAGAPACLLSAVYDPLGRGGGKAGYRERGRQEESNRRWKGWREKKNSNGRGGLQRREAGGRGANENEKSVAEGGKGVVK